MAKRASKSKAGSAGASKTRQSAKEANASRNALPASTSTGNPDRTREVQRRQSSQAAFQTNLDEEARQKDLEQSSRIERESSKGDGKRARTLSEQQIADGKGLNEKNIEARGNIDHAIVNHMRGEHEHGIGSPTARIEGPAPIRLANVKSDEQILEILRHEVKADNLYFMRREERESDEPRQHIIDAINARLREVQGDPILPE